MRHAELDESVGDLTLALHSLLGRSLPSDRGHWRAGALRRLRCRSAGTLTSHVERSLSLAAVASVMMRAWVWRRAVARKAISESDVIDVTVRG